MRKQLRNLLTLGIVASAVVLGSVSAFAADTAKQKDESLEAGFGRGGRFMQMQNAEAGEPAAHIKVRIMNFSDAVEKGIISQETADKITAYMQEQVELKKVEMKSFSDITAEERDAVKNERIGEFRKMERVDIFEELVNAGIITQTEADALKEYKPAPSFDAEFGINGEFGEKIISIGFGGMNVDALIESGIIDSATAENMKTYMEAKAEDMKAEMEALREEMEAEMEAVKNMTQEERIAYFDSNKGIKEIRNQIDILDEMVQDGVITQQQADAIKEAAPVRQMKRPEFKEDMQVTEPTAI